MELLGVAFEILQLNTATEEETLRTHEQIAVVS